VGNHITHTWDLFSALHILSFTIKLETLTVLRKVLEATPELRQLGGQFWSGFPPLDLPDPSDSLTSDEIKYVTQFHMREQVPEEQQQWQQLLVCLVPYNPWTSAEFNELLSPASTKPAGSWQQKLMYPSDTGF